MFEINGEIWRVFLVPPDFFKLRKKDGSYTIGVCDDIDKGIYIHNHLNPQLFKKVLCHEITHAAMFSYNVELTIEQEEVLADLIATYGQEIIRITNTIFYQIKRKKGTLL